MKSAAPIEFGDDCHPVAVTQFDYDALDPADESATPAANPDALEVLQHGLLVALRDGHADGMPLRVLALARMVGLFDSDAAAAESAGVDRSSVSRAVRRMRSKLQAALSPRLSARNPGKQKGTPRA